LCGALEHLCRQNCLDVHRLNIEYDIDRMNDLPRLISDLRTDRRPARLRLREWLETVELPDLDRT